MSLRRMLLADEFKDDGGLAWVETTREDELAEEEELAVGGDSGDREVVDEGAGDPRREMEESLSKTCGHK